MGDPGAAGERGRSVLGKLQDGGIEQTALHNVHESRGHVHAHGGHGAPARLAAAIHARWPSPRHRSAPPPWRYLPEASASTPPDSGQSSGITGRSTAALISGVPRELNDHADGIDVPPSMGPGDAINFQRPVGARRRITGDFVMSGMR